MRHLLTRFALSASLLIFAPPPVPAQDAPAPNPVREKYTKHEFRIRMRDGAALFTAVFTPKDMSRSYPIMMERTPYSVAPYGIDNYPRSLGPSPAFLQEGFIFVYTGCPRTLLVRRHIPRGDASQAGEAHSE